MIPCLIIQLEKFRIHRMRKKQANLFERSPKINPAHYMTAEQLRQFKKQFTLFHSNLDLQKLKQQLYQNDMGSHSIKQLQKFINSMQTNMEKISFQSYIQGLINFLEQQDQAQLIINILGGEEKQLSKNLIRQIIQQTMDRDISSKQEKQILNKIFQANSGSNQGQYIDKEIIAEILKQNRQRN